MPLDPQAKRLFELAAAAGGTPMHLQTPSEARAAMLAQTAALGPPETVASIENRSIPGPEQTIAIRIYTPQTASHVARPLGCLVFFHGGGWVIGSIDTHDGLCRTIANAVGCVVVSVEYRLAPEHPFPAAVEDAYAAVCWVVENAESLGIARERIAVGGDSAGGNLAAVAALMARDRQGPRLVRQVLLYPITDHDLNTSSYRDFAEGPMLTRDAMAWFFKHYIPEGSLPDHPYISPLRAQLHDLPPALVITAECDPLCDEGNAYARRLESAGVAVQFTCYPGMIHGFVRRHKLLTAGRQALEEIATVLRSDLNS
ncbi:MAG TPA: alpha/beta hydrolase [Pirellulales bacterium]|nr:alpha/beta hydrolase [Pirellulales bacterium]